MKAQPPGFDWENYFAGVSQAPSRALLLDYDGTLAPFRVERDRAIPYAELRDLLEALTRAARTRMVIISGRALRDLVPLLGIEPLPELWGSHGWERLDPDGRYHEPQLESAVRKALQEAQQWAQSAGLNGSCEQKPASLALHWRGVDADTVRQIEARVREAWGPLARPPLLELCEFDGGIELRAAGRDKGHAVSSILAELNESAAVAYAGDDRTDEDAFRALSGRGLSILVRPEYRETAADVWLRPPDELARFLRAWLAIDMEGE